MKAPYKNVADGLASLGRYEDSYIVHAAEGETVIPAEVLEANPSLKNSVFKQMRAMGIEDPNRYVVGNALNSINPETGQPEFFFKSIGKLFKKAAPMIGSVVGFAIGGPAGAAIGGGLGSLASGASPEQALINAGLSFAGAKFMGPMADKALGVGMPAAGAMGPTTAGTLGSVLPKGIASALPAGLSSMGVGTAAATALAPMAGKMLMDALEPEPQVAKPSGPSVVSQYYADLAAGKNPPLPVELTPPPQSSLIAQESTSVPVPTMAQTEVAARPRVIPQGIMNYQDLIDLQAGRPVLSRPLFAAASGGYITGPGGPTDDMIPTLLSNTEFVMTGKAVAGADPTGSNNPDKGAKVMTGIMRAFEKQFDKNASMMA